MGLVVSRRKGETFFIGDHVKVTAVECRQGACRLLVEAPKDWPIVREEIVYEAALKEKRQAAVDNLERELRKAKEKLSKIQGDESDVSDIGRRLTDEGENGFVPPGACVIPDAV